MSFTRLLPISLIIYCSSQLTVAHLSNFISPNSHFLRSLITFQLVIPLRLAPLLATVMPRPSSTSPPPPPLLPPAEITEPSIKKKTRQKSALTQEEEERTQQLLREVEEANRAGELSVCMSLNK